MGDRNAPKTRRMMGRTGRLGGFPGDFPAEELAGRPLRAMRAPFMRAAALFIRQRGIFLFATRHATSLLRPPARGRSRLLVATDWLKGFSHPFGPSLRPPIRVDPHSRRLLLLRKAEGTDSACGVGEVQQVEPRGERIGGYRHGLRPVVAAGQHRLPQGVHHAQRP